MSRTVVGSRRERMAVAGLRRWRADWSDLAGEDSVGREHLRAQCVAQAALKSCDGTHKEDWGDKERRGSVESWQK